jgi:hypothetical protein
MTLTRVPPQRDGSSTASVSRVKLVDQRMADLIGRLRGPEFEDVHPARWRHTATGHHVETGYSYGEGRVRVFLDGGRTADHQFVISGREDDLTSFHELFPVSSA